MSKPQPSVKVPEPRQSKRRPSAVSRVFVWTFLILLFGAVAAGGAAFYVHSEYTAPGPLADKTIYTVEQGGVAEVGEALEKNGIISNARIFSLMASVTGTRSRLKAGEYDFPKAASMQDVMALIASGKSITYKLSIPEGFTSEMAVARVNANEVLAGPPAVVPPEGSIMPDTYVFRRGMTRQKLVDDMQAAQVKLLEELWQTRQPSTVVETKEAAVILASIVEKETGVAAERPVIASVFINRLKKNMRLQSDPTIIYGIVGGKGKLDRALTRNDIETETPYNTYRINGLPPGPIANPGRAAIEAVLNPQSTDYLYFVADGSGGHAFASTLNEHNRNVRKWREIAGNAAAAIAAEEPEPDSGAAPADATPADGA
ncbi:endolytic transglycosylase MltG, partial [Aestuariivirga sp.]|uniref:endolytic transglycosylase MltG n=1 Tax=Aestuariivirga sp. TaxID=2650926 RepID=UPI00359337BE